MRVNITAYVFLDGRMQQCDVDGKRVADMFEAKRWMKRRLLKRYGIRKPLVFVRSSKTGHIL